MAFVKAQGVSRQANGQTMEGLPGACKRSMTAQRCKSRLPGGLLTRTLHGARTPCAFGVQICSRRFVFGYAVSRRSCREPCGRTACDPVCSRQTGLLATQKTNSPGANLDSQRLPRRAKPTDGFCSVSRLPVREPDSKGYAQRNRFREVIFGHVLRTVSTIRTTMPLRAQMTEAMQVRGVSDGTHESYLQAVSDEGIQESGAAA